MCLLLTNFPDVTHQCGRHIGGLDSAGILSTRWFSRDWCVGGSSYTEMLSALRIALPLPQVSQGLSLEAQSESPEPGTGIQTSCQFLHRAVLPCVNLQSPLFAWFLVAMTVEPRALHMLATAVIAKPYP